MGHFIGGGTYVSAEQCPVPVTWNRGSQRVLHICPASHRLQALLLFVSVC